MVKHIVMWKWKDEVKQDHPEALVASLQERFKALLDVVPGLKEIEFGANYNGGEYDIALYCAFATKEDQDAYQTNPAHLAVAETVRASTCGRACVDYEIA